MEKPLSAYKGDGRYAFVCYAHEDADAVYREIAWLNECGVNVWFDEGISPGQEWTEELANAIQGCSRVLYFVTPNSVVSKHCRRELNFAQEEDRDVVAIYLQATDVPAGLRLSLNDRQAILKYELPDEEYRKRLLRVTEANTEPELRPAIQASDRRPKVRLTLTLGFTGLVALAVGIWWSESRREPSADAVEVATREPASAISADILDNSIAVLPFANLSPDPDNAYFAAGIHEEILNQLAKIKDLSVIARTTMTRYADTALSVPEIGSELNVQTVMEGSVRYSENRVRITVQLIDATSGTNIWSQSYEDDLVDVFGIQLTIASRIAETLETDLSPAERQRIGRRVTDNAKAYALYLKALSSWGNLAHTEAIHDALDGAITLDPGFAAALAYKAWLYGAASYFGFSSSMSFSFEEQERLIALAAQFAGRALEIDDKQALAYLAMNFVHLHDRRWQAADRGVRRAEALGPNNYLVANGAGWGAYNRNDIESAITHLERSVELNPADAANIWDFGRLLYQAERWDAAAQQAVLVTALLPDSPLGFAQLAMIKSHLGDSASVRRNGILAEARQPSMYELASIALAYGKIGDADDARRIFDQSGAGNESQISDLGWQFWIHMAVKEYNTAIRYLEQAIESNFPFVIAKNLYRNPSHPDFDPVRSDPRFNELVRRVASPLTSPNSRKNLAR